MLRSGMTRFLCWSVLGCFVSIAAVGCSEDGVDVEALADGAIASSDRIQDALNGTCDCFAEFGFADEAACMEAVGTVDITIDRQCTIDALKIDPEAASANFECERDNLDSLAECFETAIAECNQDSFVSCNEEEGVMCPEIPKEMDDALGECIE